MYSAVITRLLEASEDDLDMKEFQDRPYGKSIEKWRVAMRFRAYLGTHNINVYKENWNTGKKAWVINGTYNQQNVKPGMTVSLLAAKIWPDNQIESIVVHVGRDGTHTFAIRVTADSIWQGSAPVPHSESQSVKIVNNLIEADEELDMKEFGPGERFTGQIRSRENYFLAVVLCDGKEVYRKIFFHYTNFRDDIKKQLSMVVARANQQNTRLPFDPMTHGNTKFIAWLNTE